MKPAGRGWSPDPVGGDQLPSQRHPVGPVAGIGAAAKHGCLGRSGLCRGLCVGDSWVATAVGKTPDPRLNGTSSAEDPSRGNLACCRPAVLVLRFWPHHGRRPLMAL